MAAIPLINGINYSWGNIKMILFGVPIIGITKIDYKRTQKKDNNYGWGYEPISRGYGNIEYEASIEIYQDELKRIIASAPNNDVLSIAPFDIQIIYAGNNATIKIDTLQMCEFKNDTVTASQDDSKLLVTIDLVIAGILHE
jgi:hypothetical protein